MSSTPMLSRISLGLAPESERILCSMSDSTPPRLVAGYDGLIRQLEIMHKNLTHNKVFSCLR